MSNESKELIVLSSIILLIVLIFSFILFGITGIRVVLAIIFMSLPFYTILNNFEFTAAEKFVFSILMGITIFPSLVYLLGLVVSFKIAIIVTFLVFIILALILFISRQQNKSS